MPDENDTRIFVEVRMANDEITVDVFSPGEIREYHPAVLTSVLRLDRFPNRPIKVVWPEITTPVQGIPLQWRLQLDDTFRLAVNRAIGIAIFGEAES